jgi:hypothetical protein
LSAAPALAQSATEPARSAHLLDAADGSALAMAAPSMAQLAPQASDVSGSEAFLPGPAYGVHFAKTFGAGVVGSTAGVLLGTALGQLSNDLIWSALPVLLSNLFVGPIVTVLVAMLVGNDGSSGRYGFWGPVGVAFALNAALYVVVSLALNVAVSYATPLPLLLYTLVDSLLMTGGSVGLMHLTEKKVASSAIPSFIPGVTDTQVAALSTVRF